MYVTKYATFCKISFSELSLKYQSKIIHFDLLISLIVQSHTVEISNVIIALVIPSETKESHHGNR
jgi:hypothetical protein